jgi:hypothetical protein
MNLGGRVRHGAAFLDRHSQMLRRLPIFASGFSWAMPMGQGLLWRPIFRFFALGISWATPVGRALFRRLIFRLAWAVDFCSDMAVPLLGVYQGLGC